MHGSQVWDVYLRGGLAAHPRLLRNRRAQHLSDLSALRAAARAFERGRARARDRRACANCSQDSAAAHLARIPGRVARELKPAARSKRRTSWISPTTAGVSRASRARRYSSKARCRASASAFASSSAAANWTRRVWSRCCRRRPTGWHRDARISGSAADVRLQHLAPAAQLAAKQRQLLDNLERIGGCGRNGCSRRCAARITAYRRRARLGVKYVHKKGRVLCGFRERDKPYLADIRRCEILARAVRDAAGGTGRSGRDASRCAKRLPQVELRRARR